MIYRNVALEMLHLAFCGPLQHADSAKLLYLQDDDGDDGHLWTQPREEALQLTALTNQVTVHDDGN